MRKSKSDDTEKLKAELLQGRSPETGFTFTKHDFVSSGSTLMNLAAANRAFGAFAKGKYYLSVGDSSSGKTFLALTCLAEAARNPDFDNYRLIYDDVEGGALMDIKKFFGQKLAQRLEVFHSTTAEDFYYHLDDVLKGKQPCLYILDSENALSSGSEEDKFDEQKKAFEANRDVAGSYGDGKAKIHSQNLRRVCADLRDTGSILIMLAQTRDNLGFGFEKKTRSGGRSLKFYAALEMWFSVKEKIKRTVQGKPRQIGITAEVQFKKNRFTGKDRTVTLDIYHSVGIDDIGSCVDYLVEEGRFRQNKGTIEATEFDFAGSRDALIRHIEENNLERKVSLLVSDVWKEIEAACAVQRKPRYE